MVTGAGAEAGAGAGRAEGPDELAGELVVCAGLRIGFSSSGSVARLAAAGSVGRYSGPVWPQPDSQANEASDANEASLDNVTRGVNVPKCVSAVGTVSNPWALAFRIKENLFIIKL